MDEIEFRVASEDAEGLVAPGLTIHPVVNGVTLRELARTVELEPAERDGQPSLAGSYLGLDPSLVGWPARHFLAEPIEQWFEDGDTTLLDCVCRVPGCWPLTAIVDMGDAEVVWRNFRNGHRDWDLSALGPFVFDRTRYETALRATRQRT